MAKSPAAAAPTAAPPVSAPAPIPFPLLRFGALAWIVVNQFRDHLGLHAGAHSGLVAKGYLGADVYLILAGLLACRALGGAADRPRAWGAAGWRAIAPNYPLHLFAMAAMAALLMLGDATHAGFDQTPFNLAALPANLLLVHAWGVLPSVYWNFPSWMLSAELAGWLVLPALLWFAAGRPVRTALAALVIFEAMFAVAALLGVLFTDMTAQIGALRAGPDFLMGAAIALLADRIRLPRAAAQALAAGLLGAIVLGVLTRVSDMLLWPAFAALVFALAARRASAPAQAPESLAQKLGRMAYAMYLSYLPVDIAYFHAMRRLFGTVTGWEAWAVWAGVFPVILAVGALAYVAIERPAARRLLALRWPRSAAPAPLAADAVRAGSPGA